MWWLSICESVIHSPPPLSVKSKSKCVCGWLIEMNRIQNWTCSNGRFFYLRISTCSFYVVLDFVKTTKFLSTSVRLCVVFAWAQFCIYYIWMRWECVCEFLNKSVACSFANQLKGQLNVRGVLLLTCSCWVIWMMQCYTIEMTSRVQFNFRQSLELSQFFRVWWNLFCWEQFLMFGNFTMIGPNVMWSSKV